MLWVREMFFMVAMPSPAVASATDAQANGSLDLISSGFKLKEEAIRNKLGVSGLDRKGQS